MTTALLDRLSAPAPATPAALPRHYLLTRFRALALFGRRPAERVVRSVLPASENLHNSRPSGRRSRTSRRLHPESCPYNGAPACYRHSRRKGGTQGWTASVADRSSEGGRRPPPP